MASGLDMSLDDMIVKNRISRSSNSRGRPPRGSGSGSRPGPARRLPNRRSNRSAPYTTAKAPETTWQHDMFSDEPPHYQTLTDRASAIETGTKLYISNLDYGVSNEDLKELFAEVGDLKRYTVHYDRSGRSKGTAEIVFSRRVDALTAFKKYNNVQLDGKPMKIEIVGTNLSTPVSRPAYADSNGVKRRRGRQGKGGPLRRQRGGGGKAPAEKISAEDLDADLEKYHSEAMPAN